ncbi:nitrate- and nitrite sensing domain-containing protein [Thermocatellispora tengchongensis]|uniref:nitrate- and nitrite sensing domain-containing protein n=1 Tax=Thermocatellispora tengchongensis TaxID=1073253 RepID=UPI003628A118
MRTRLVALVIVPTITGVILGGVQIVSSISTANEYGRAGEIAAFALKLSRLAHEVELERDLSARYVAEGRRDTARIAMEQQQKAVDDKLSDVRAGIDAAELVSGETGGSRTRAEIVQIRSRINELKGTRALVAGTAIPASRVVEIYNGVVTDLLAVHDEIGQGVTDDEA